MLTAAILLVTHATVGPTMFGRPGEWYVVSRSGELLSQHQQFAGREAADATVSPDGRVFVFTSWEPSAENFLLYKWSESKQTAELLSEPRGFHAAPTFTDDGKWVYFAHHPGKGGPPGEHEPGAFAQLYRVKLDGSALERLTDAPGCHMQPATADGPVVAIAHTDCAAGRSIELWRGKNQKPISINTGLGEHGWPTFALKPMRIAYVFETRVDSVVYEYDLARRSTKELFHFNHSADSARLAFGSGASLLFQNQTGVYRYRGGTQTEIVRFKEAK